MENHPRLCQPFHPDHRVNTTRPFAPLLRTYTKDTPLLGKKFQYSDALLNPLFRRNLEMPRAHHANRPRRPSHHPLNWPRRNQEPSCNKSKHCRHHFGKEHAHYPKAYFTNNAETQTDAWQNNRASNPSSSSPTNCSPSTATVSANGRAPKQTPFSIVWKSSFGLPSWLSLAWEWGGLPAQRPRLVHWCWCWRLLLSKLERLLLFETFGKFERVADGVCCAGSSVFGWLDVRSRCIGERRRVLDSMLLGPEQRRRM